MSDSTDGLIRAVAAPWTNRPATSTAGSGASPHAVDAAINRYHPARQHPGGARDRRPLGQLSLKPMIGWCPSRYSANNGTVKSTWPRRGAQMSPFWMRLSRCGEGLALAFGTPRPRHLHRRVNRYVPCSAAISLDTA